MTDFNQATGSQTVELARRRVVPAWTCSLLLHMVLITLLAITIKIVPRGVADEPDRTTGIVLKHVDEAGEYYEGEELNIEAASETASGEPGQNALVEALPAENQSPLDPNKLLPNPSKGIGPTAGEIGGGGAVGLAGEAPGTRQIRGGKARTGVFGLSGEGYKFAYVFDSSASMSSHQGRPLAAAKRELIGSVQSLGRLHQFLIIFYNEQPRVFNPTGVAGRLYFATEENKKSAARFVKGVDALLSTDHMPALMLAINSQPDVLFFLTDGEQPRLTGDELARIARRNRGGSTIHVIQFGTSSPSQNNWLMRLARQNGGKYKFFNVRRLSPRG